jgi:hypothetical protein
MIRINYILNIHRLYGFKYLRNGMFLLTFFFLLPTLLMACGSQPRSPEDQIRSYIFENPSATGEQFVDWADENLSEYSDRKIYSALYNEGKAQGEQGHPNAIAALSFAARAWAEDKGLPYSPNRWLELQQNAISNLHEPSNGKFPFWPTK